MNSAGEAFAYPFRDPGWLGKVLLQGLILIIPVVGWISATGWMMLAFENVRFGRPELPRAGFHLSRGVGMFFVFFVYWFVLNIPAWIFYIASGIASALSGHGVNVSGPLSSVGFLLGFLAGLFLNFLTPSLIVNTYHGGFAGGVDVERVWRLATSNVRNALIAGVVVWVATIIGGLGAICCFIGLFFTIIYQNAVQAGIAAWFERVQPTQPAPAAPPA